MVVVVESVEEGVSTEPLCESESGCRGGGHKKKQSSFAKLMGSMGEDISWMDSDSDADDEGPRMPF